MGSDFLKELFEGFNSDNVGENVEKTITDAIGSKMKDDRTM